MTRFWPIGCRQRWFANRLPEEMVAPAYLSFFLGRAGGAGELEGISEDSKGSYEGSGALPSQGSFTQPGAAVDSSKRKHASSSQPSGLPSGLGLCDSL